jgi:hypothetical protein
MEDCHDMHTPLTAADTDWQFFFFIDFYFGHNAQLFLKPFQLFPLPAAAEKAIMSDFYKSFW